MNAYDLSGCFNGHNESNGHQPANGGATCNGNHGTNPNANLELRRASLARQFASYVPAVPARLELAIAFPPTYGFYGGLTTIHHLSRLGLYRGHLGLTPDKRAAVGLIVRANMESQQSDGRGSRFARRLHQLHLRMAEAVNGHAFESDLNRHAAIVEEHFTEGRVYRHRSPVSLAS